MSQSEHSADRAEAGAADAETALDKQLMFQQYWEAERRQEQGQGQGQGQQAYADFVVSLRFDTGGDRARAAATAAAALQDTVTRLVQAGLVAEVRQAVRARRRHGLGHGAAYAGDGAHVLVFVSCPRARLVGEWRRSRLHDWLGGMLALRRVSAAGSGGGGGGGGGGGSSDPYEVDADARDDPARLLEADGGTADGISVAERQRLVHGIIAAAGVGGAGVEVVALHDGAFNSAWVRHWARKWLVDGRDLRRIREHFGEEIALYFAFVQSYFVWLALPAAVGVAAHVTGRSFAWPLAAALVVWTVAFTETWARREADIATYWGVHGVERAGDTRRAAFRPARYEADAVTGESVPVFPAPRRWARRALGVAVVAALAGVLAALVAAIFALQTFAGELYAGPLAPAVSLVPVVLFSACLPLYTSACTRVALALTEYENYEYEGEFATQLTAKLFVFRFLEDQLYLFLTAWVLVPHRDAFEHWARRAAAAVAGPKTAAAVLKPSDTPAAGLVQGLLAGFIVTSQLVNLATETLLPLALRWWAARARRETRLPGYSTFEDYAEMASQFGRVAFFSVAWPLAPLAAFANNWLELRADAAKIAGATQRPIPRRVASIGPWLRALRLMCWLASITNALLVYQFSPATGLLLPPVEDPAAMRRYGRTALTMALVVLLFAEHAFLALRWLLVRAMASSWPSAYDRIVARDHARSRRRWLERAPLAVRDLAYEPDSAAADDADDANADAGAAGVADWRAELTHGLHVIDGVFKTG
ncbi:hypothetical protein GGI15_001246 [Coemansia interrupta]|uniref:Uncharacterized protein n=1 Tax=Coemansia interrupta TaxID=1126814 RepID=A0A9W8HN51_9FUNG|nr:hypothetical protein GGI15_001246 [Coemansia interrupta]